jgi:predicted dehydrogenase
VCIAEAFMVRHHPQWEKVRELVRAGRIGTPRAVQAVFAYFNDDPADVRNQADIGGGGLYDIGCYAIVTARYVFEAEPVRAVALIDRDARFRTDRLTSGLLDFGECRHLSFTVSTQCRSHQRVTILGTQGRIEVMIPFNPPSGGAARIHVDGDVVTLPPADQYQRMAEDFSRAVRGERPLSWGVGDAIAQMKVIDALWRSEHSGAWVTV